MTLPDSLIGLLGLVAAGAVALAAVLVLRLHLLPTGLDPIHLGVSGYALGPWGHLYRSQVLACGLAAILIATGLVAAGRGPALGIGALLVYAASRAAIVRYPTDPPDADLTPAGRTHALLAAAAFLSLGVAAPVLGPGLAGDAPWSRLDPLLSALSVAVPVSVAGTLAAGGWPPLRRAFGLIERTFYASGLAWLLCVALGLAALGIA